MSVMSFSELLICSVEIKGDQALHHDIITQYVPSASTGIQLKKHTEA